MRSGEKPDPIREMKVKTEEKDLRERRMGSIIYRSMNRG